MLNAIIQNSIIQGLKTLGTIQSGTWIITDFSGYSYGIFQGLGVEGAMLSNDGDGELFYRLAKDDEESKNASQLKTSNCLSCGRILRSKNNLCMSCME